MRLLSGPYTALNPLVLSAIVAPVEPVPKPFAFNHWSYVLIPEASSTIFCATVLEANLVCKAWSDLGSFLAPAISRIISVADIPGFCFCTRLNSCIWASGLFAAIIAAIAF